MKTLTKNGLALVVMAVVLATPALAQVAQVNTTLTTIKSILTGVSVVVVTIAIMWAGFKMIFQHAKFGDIANIFIGAMLIGGAAGIAGVLIPGGGA